MTQDVPLFHNANLASNEAQTHVLIIGVGHYPHLTNGDPSRPAKRMFNLDQLTASTVSATKLAAWFRQSHRNPRAPLGTIDLLLSGSAPATGPTKMATHEAIGKAFTRWRSRCDSSSNNVAIFYFCGHGFGNELGDVVLLPSDFGDPEESLIWKRAINISTTINNMANCKAATQCFFLDACRNPPPLNDDERAQFRCDPLCPPDFPYYGRDVCTLYAAKRGSVVSASKGTASRFSRALMECFDGTGAYLDDDRWVINTSSLLGAMRLRDCLEDGPGCLDCKGEGGAMQALHEIQPPFHIWAKIECEPDTAQRHAHLAIHDRLGRAERRPEHVSTPWRPKVEAGRHYDVTAHFQTDSYNATKVSRHALPPLMHCVLKVEKQS